jgi:hypothetical protein
MRQLAPRGSQVAAVRAALRSSDRYWRLALSMSRQPTTAGTRVGQQVASAATLNSCSAAVAGPLEASGEAEHAPPPRAQAAGSVGHSGVSMPSASWDDVTRDGSGGESALITSSSSYGASRQVSAAFRTVAVSWLLMRRRVCQLAYSLVAVDILLLNVLWMVGGSGAIGGGGGGGR